MAAFHSGRMATALSESGAFGTSAGAADEVLGPVMAGAYARGVAETLDLLGIPGVFLDGSGEVLFASRAAAPLLRGPLRLRTRHLVAEDADDNQVLAAFVADAMGAAADGSAVRLPAAGLELRRLPRTEALALPGQRVRAMVLLLDDAEPRHAALLHLRG